MRSNIDRRDFGSANIPRRQSADVRRVVANDVSALSRVLARAFERDPFIRWLVRQDERRTQRTEWTFEVMLRRLSSGLNETHTSTDLTGAALWKRPGEFKLALGQQLQLLPAFARSMGWSRIPAFLNLLQRMERLHERLVPEPHFYLFVLGVDPDHERRGIGSKLLAPVLELCDRERKRAYLETSREDNLPFYVRQGFELAQMVEHPQWPKFWLMLREPATM